MIAAGAVKIFDQDGRVRAVGDISGTPELTGKNIAQRQIVPSGRQERVNILRFTG